MSQSLIMQAVSRLAVLAVLAFSFPALFLSEASPLISDAGQSVLKSHLDSTVPRNQTKSNQDELFHAQVIITNALLSHAEELETYSIRVELGGQYIDLLIDTGSTGTWVATHTTPYKTECVEENSVGLSEECRFKNPNFNFDQFKAKDGFYIKYDAKEYADGALGFANILIPPGPTFEATIGVATHAFFHARGVTQGVMGLAPEAQSDEDLPPILKSYIMATGQPEVFTLALSRVDGGPSLVCFGDGLEQNWAHLGITVDQMNRVDNVPCWANDPDRAGHRRPSQPGDKPYYWAIEANTFRITSSSGHQNVITKDMPGKTEIDSGTDHLLLPLSLARYIHDCFEPPIAPSLGYRTPKIDCNSEPPLVEVQIGDKYFPIAPDDLKMKWGENDCQSMIEAIDKETSMILGTPFLKNVVAEHNAAGLTMSFYHRMP